MEGLGGRGALRNEGRGEEEGLDIPRGCSNPGLGSPAGQGGRCVDLVGGSEAAQLRKKRGCAESPGWAHGL